MAHLSSNDLISRIESTNLINTRDLAHCAEQSVFPLILKKIYFFLGGDNFDDVVEVEELIWNRPEWALG